MNVGKRSGQITPYNLNSQQSNALRLQLELYTVNYTTKVVAFRRLALKAYGNYMRQLQSKSFQV